MAKFEANEAQATADIRKRVPDNIAMDLSEIAEELANEASDLPRLDFQEKLVEALHMAATSGFDFGWSQGKEWGAEAGKERGRGEIMQQIKDHYYRPFYGTTPDVIRVNDLMDKLRSNEVALKSKVGELEQMLLSSSAPRSISRLLLKLRMLGRWVFWTALVAGGWVLGHYVFRR